MDKKTEQTTNKVEFVHHKYKQPTEERCVVCNRPMYLSGNYYRLNGQPIETGCLKNVKRTGSLELCAKWHKEKTLKAMGLDPSKIKAKVDAPDDKLMESF